MDGLMYNWHKSTPDGKSEEGPLTLHSKPFLPPSVSNLPVCLAILRGSEDPHGCLRVNGQGMHMSQA